MKYNLTQYSQTISNTAEGSIDLSTNEIISIINFSSVANVLVPVSGTVSGTLVLDCDLGSRLHIYEVQYHFTSSAAQSTVSSGIKFFYKNESFETYTSLNTYYNDDYYYTVVSGTSAPRYIRVEHTVISGGVSGYINGLYVLNDDTYVDFGEDGTATNTNFNVSVENNIVEVNELEVFNSGPVKATAKLIIEPQNTVADNILSISDSSAGPWYGVYRDEDKITGSDLWDTGNMEDLYISSDILKLVSGKTVGTYTTRVVGLDEYQRLTFNVMGYDYPIVSPTVEFFDNFTSGLFYWDIISGSWVDVSQNYLWLRSDPDRVRTKESIDMSADWEATFKCYPGWRYTRTDVRFCYLGDGGEVRVRISCADDAYDRLEVYTDGNLRITFDMAVWAYKWLWVKLHKNFNVIKLKVWPTDESEPSNWYDEVLFNDDISEFGKMDVYLYDNWTNIGGGLSPGFYMDDITITANYSAFPDAESLISIDVEDTTETIEVRSSNSRPLNRETYIRMTGSYGSSTKYTNHYWIEDSTSAEQSSDWGTWGRSGNYWEYWYDSVREDEYIIDKPFYTGGSTQVFFRIRRKNGTLYSVTITSANYGYDCFYSTYKLTPDTTGGFWINFFLARTNINTGIYYLRYYNSTMGLVYNRQATADQGTFMYDMDAVYGASGQLWYTDRDLSTVFKINTDGIILASYLATDSIRGILSLEDGGCWFIQEEVLIRLDTYGRRIDIIDLPTPLASYIYSDLHDGFWLHEGDNVYHLNSDGTEDFIITIENLYFITVIDSGFITKQHDGSTSTPPQASYVSTDHKRVIRTWNYPQNEGGYEGTFDINKFGVRSQTYDDLVDDHASNFPIGADSNWNNAAWTSVSIRDYNFTNEQYHQLRFTLRSDNSANSPEVYGLWTQRAIEIPDIYPGNYGKFYLKSDISYLDPQDAGNYTSKVRAYWLLSTE